MSSEIPQAGSKDIPDQATVDRAARLLAADAADVFVMHNLHEELYVIKTIPFSTGSGIFTAPFKVTQVALDSHSGFKRIDRLDDIGFIQLGYSLTELISDVVESNPGIGIVLDRETAIKLTQEKLRKIALIDYGDKHCLLTGINSRGIDVYLAPDIENITVLGDSVLAQFSE